MANNYDNMNANDFTQKDLMLHLLQVSQHTVTREELKEDILELKQDISRLELKIGQVETRLETRITQVETRLSDRLLQVESKQDRLQWLIVGGTLSILLKDYILGIIG